MTWDPRDFSPRKLHLLDQAFLHCKDRGFTDLKNAVETNTAAAELVDLKVGGVATKEPVTDVLIVKDAGKIEN